MQTIKGADQLGAELLRIREDQFNDVKDKRVKPAELQRSFVAFANTDGGDLYIGLADASVSGNRISGFAKEEDANEHIATVLTETQPSVDGVEAEFIDFGKDGLVLHLNVPKSPQVHYAADK